MGRTLSLYRTYSFLEQSGPLDAGLGVIDLQSRFPAEKCCNQVVAGLLSHQENTSATRPAWQWYGRFD